MKYITPVIIIAIIAVCAVLLAYALRFEIEYRRISKYGRTAQKKVANLLVHHFSLRHVMNFVKLSFGGFQTDIDHIVICDFGVAVIETVSHKGRIETGGENSENVWLQQAGGKKVYFNNPTKKNEDSAEMVRLALVDEMGGKIPVYSVIVFANNNVEFTERPPNVVTYKQLLSFLEFINMKSKVRLSEAEKKQVRGILREYELR